MQIHSSLQSPDDILLGCSYSTQVECSHYSICFLTNLWDCGGMKTITTTAVLGDDRSTAYLATGTSGLESHV
jgi:hypothetical protein